MDDLYDFTENFTSVEPRRFCGCMLHSDDCHCGANNGHEWEWDKQHCVNCTVSEDNLEVEFHKRISYCKAVAKGNKLLEKGRHHYWEIEILTHVFGTDIMIGVGTSKMNFANYETDDWKFYSLLGLDYESFGYSHKGYMQHGGEQCRYGIEFMKGDIVGVYLDTWKGTLEFFVNRKPLGIVVAGLRDAKLYPMVSAAVEQTKVRLIRSCSVPASLQMECLAVLSPLERKNLSTVFPGLRYLSQSVFTEVLQKH